MKRISAEDGHRADSSSYFSGEKQQRATPGVIAGGHRSAGARLVSHFSWIISFNLPSESILRFAHLTDDPALAELVFGPSTLMLEPTLICSAFLPVSSISVKEHYLCTWWTTERSHAVERDPLQSNRDCRYVLGF